MKLKCFRNSLKKLCKFFQIPSLSFQDIDESIWKESIRASIGAFNIAKRRILNFSVRKNLVLERDAKFPWKTAIVFYPNRVTATRFQRTSRRKSPRLLNETRAQEGQGNFLQRNSSWGRGIPRMAARATRQTRGKNL